MTADRAWQHFSNTPWHLTNIFGEKTLSTFYKHEISLSWKAIFSILLFEKTFPREYLLIQITVHVSCEFGPNQFCDCLDIGSWVHQAYRQTLIIYLQTFCKHHFWASGTPKWIFSLNTDIHRPINGILKKNKLNTYLESEDPKGIFPPQSQNNLYMITTLSVYYNMRKYKECNI